MFLKEFFEKVNFEKISKQLNSKCDVQTLAVDRPGAKYIEKYSNTLQLFTLINDYNYRICRNVMITITITLEI